MWKEFVIEKPRRLACMQLCPFPRLHFFTLSTALGTELEDGEVNPRKLTRHSFKFGASFGRSALGFIEANFYKQILILSAWFEIS